MLPELSVLSEVARLYAWTLATVGHEAGRRPLVVPASSCFPDRFTGDSDSLQRLVDRMRAHAGLDDVPVQAALLDDDASCESGGGGCGSCAPSSRSEPRRERVVDDGESWRIQLAANEAQHHVWLTTFIARTLGRVFLVETLAPGESPPASAEVAVDVAAVALGFGPLLCEGAYVYAKSCGGPAIDRFTALGPGELAFLTALFAATQRHPLRGAERAASPTQRELLVAAGDLVASNPDLVSALAERPAIVAAAPPQLVAARPLLVRWFTRRKRPESARAALDRGASLEELEALVARER